MDWSVFFVLKELQFASLEIKLLLYLNEDNVKNMSHLSDLQDLMSWDKKKTQFQIRFFCSKTYSKIETYNGTLSAWYGRGLWNCNERGKDEIL
jgi:hypothetical protein